MPSVHRKGAVALMPLVSAMRRELLEAAPAVG